MGMTGQHWALCGDVLKDNDNLACLSFLFLFVPVILFYLLKCILGDTACLT
uniref:Uncharacterized protein n=1 Tax=Anguilla anguilla TaxID=7936 RepID=A0A0E9QJQ4_ANGAN